MRIKTFLLGVVMAATLFSGIWLLISPSLNRQADLAQQEDLLESIMAAIAYNEAFMYEPTIAESATERQDDNYVSDEPLPVTPPPVPLNHADFPSGIIPIGILTIDSIDLRLPIMEGVDEPELRIAPGRVPQTAVVGEIGNAVIAGHRNFTFGSMFNRLGEVEIGDLMEFQAMSGEVMAFEVFEILVITPCDQIAFIQPQNEAIIALYTCTPIREATHRLLVRAIKIEGGI